VLGQVEGALDKRELRLTTMRQALIIWRTRQSNVFRSRFPDADIPSVCLTDFVLGAPDADDDRPALVCGVTGRSLSFGDLRTQVRRVAAGLSRRVRKSDVVAIWAPNMPEYAVVFHAVISLGAVLTTINPAYTSQEAAYQLRDANAILLVTTAALSARALEAVDASGMAIAVITIDEAPDVASPTSLTSLASIAIDTDPPPVAIDPAVDIAVLPYSSGTTGLTDTDQGAIRSTSRCRSFWAVIPAFFTVTSRFPRRVNSPPLSGARNSA
jgi:non-ribosomal peptide synthetase component F